MKNISNIPFSSKKKTDDPDVLASSVASNTAQLASNTQDIQGRGINAMNPPAPLVAPKGDGTDDSAAIQAIINYGGTIYFPAKTFGIGTPLTLTNSACLIGTVIPSTGFTTTFKATSALSQMLTVKQPSNNGAGSGTIQNIIFDGNNNLAVDGIHLGVSGSALGSNMANSMVFRNITCQFFSGVGCQTYANTFILRFYDCVFGQNGTNGFNWNSGVDSGENIAFFGCVFFNNHQYNIYIDGAGFLNFHGCSFDYASTAQAMYVTGNGNHVKCFGCHFESNNQLIWVGNGGNIFEAFGCDYVLGGGTASGTYAIVSSGDAIMTIIGGNMIFNAAGLTDFALSQNVSAQNTVSRINGCHSSFIRLNDSSFTPTIGTMYQNNSPYMQTYVFPVTFNPTAGATAELDVKLGSSSNPGTWFSDIEPINSVAGKVRNIILRVPPFYYYGIFGTNITVGSTTVSYLE